MNKFILHYTNDNIKEIVEEKHLYFCNQIKPKERFVNKTKIKWKTYPLVDNKDGTYFHIITKDASGSEGSCCPNILIKCDKDFSYNPLMDDKYKEKRFICPHKIQSMIQLENFFKRDDLKIWSRIESTPRGRRERIKALDVKNKYLVILDKRKNGDILFWTAYPVDYTFKLNKFLKEFNKYKNKASVIKLAQK